MKSIRGKRLLIIDSFMFPPHLCRETGEQFTTNKSVTEIIFSHKRSAKPAAYVTFGDIHFFEFQCLFCISSNLLRKPIRKFANIHFGSGYTHWALYN